MWDCIELVSTCSWSPCAPQWSPEFFGPQFVSHVTLGPKEDALKASAFKHQQLRVWSETKKKSHFVDYFGCLRKHWHIVSISQGKGSVLGGLNISFNILFSNCTISLILRQYSITKAKASVCKSTKCVK